VPVDYTPSPAELRRFLPEIVLVVSGTLIMVGAAARGRRRTGGFALAALCGFVAALAASVYAYHDPGTCFREMLVVDGFTTLFRMVVTAAGALTVMISVAYLRREAAESGEYYALLLFSVTGQCLMAGAADMLMIFIGLEISSIASYILAGYLPNERRASEAALKYFLLGSFATAILLYGVALVYGVAGSTFLLDIRSDVRTILTASGMGGMRILMLVAAAFIFAGLAFKTSAWPFQAWTPDVYQGAPAPVAAFLSAGPKAAAFAVLLRVFMTAFDLLSPQWVPLLWIAALATMVVGNFAALVQSDIKRMLAYSSIAHAGYVLVAVVAASSTGIAAAMFYLVAYVIMNVGAFGVVTHVCGKGEGRVNLEDLRGLASRQPLTAALFSMFLMSLIGVPLTAGFFGKFYLFMAALEADLLWLTVLGLLCSVVAAFYYLRVIVIMYMRDPEPGTQELPPLAGMSGVAIWVCAIGTLVLGVAPSLILNFANQSAALGW
jgi:NADH-quinone oxidoreductase subunit N